MLIAAGLIVLAFVVALAAQVEDWSRDLSINYAATSPDASDVSLRTLEVAANSEAVRAAIIAFVERSPSWSVNPSVEVSSEPTSLALIRTSRLFRFDDDVNVSWQPMAAGTKIDVTSQSRVGKGDLGQNPRNIRQLLKAIQTDLADKS